MTADEALIALSRAALKHPGVDVAGILLDDTVKLFRRWEAEHAFLPKLSPASLPKRSAVETEDAWHRRVVDWIELWTRAMTHELLRRGIAPTKPRISA